MLHQSGTERHHNGTTLNNTKRRTLHHHELPHDDPLEVYHLHNAHRTQNYTSEGTQQIIIGTIPRTMQ